MFLESVFRKKKCSSFPLPPVTVRQIGAEEETKALDFLVQKGWKLIERNYQRRAGEIDLIMSDKKNSVIFVEVKYRRSSDYGTAQSFVHQQKQKKIIKTALLYMKEKGFRNVDVRFDVVAVTLDQIEHISNAFSAEGYTI